jgi:dTDP-4-dehydrorhamnose 3,5-epimerase-like enzyme
MIFKETELKGAYSIILEKNEDERGFLPAIFVSKNLKM